MHRVKHFLAYSACHVPVHRFRRRRRTINIIVIKKFMFNPMDVTVPAGTRCDLGKSGRRTAHRGQPDG